MHKRSFFGFLAQEIELRSIKSTMLLLLKVIGIRKVNETLAEIFHEEWLASKIDAYDDVSGKYDEANRLLEKAEEEDGFR